VFGFKFTMGDEVVLVKDIPAQIPLGTAGLVFHRLSVYDDGVVNEYEVYFVALGSFTVREEDIEHYGPLDRIAKET
jgi:hypothetical protein